MPDFRPIRSRAHPFLRRLRALARDSGRRREEQVYIAEGVRWVEEALAARAPIEAVLVSPGLGRNERGARARAALAVLRCERFEAPDALLEAVGHAHTAQGVILLLRRPDDSLSDLAARASPAPARSPARAVPPGGTASLEAAGPWVVACGVQDPGNLGGLLRTSRALGAAGFITGGGADLFHPRAVRASAGALLDLPVASAAGTEELVGFLRGLDARAAVPRGGADPRQFTWNGRSALVLGGEGAGLPPAVEQACNGRVSVPMRAGSESLNVSAAAAALLAVISCSGAGGRGAPRNDRR